MIILEIIGAIFAIIGVILISKAKDESIYRANIFFFIGNMAMFAFFLFNGLISIMILMILFFITSILGIMKLSKNKKRDQYILMTILSIYSTILFIYINVYGIDNVNFEIRYLDSFASVLAITGAFLLPYNDFVKRNVAYLLFIFADIIFVYIGATNGFYFFMLQSLFYIGTSSIGLKNNIKINNNLNLKTI